MAGREQAGAAPPDFSAGVLPDEHLAGYRDGMRALTRLVMAGACVILLLTLGLTALTWRGYPEDRYHAMAFDGRSVGLRGLHDPSTNINVILGWVSMVATQVMTFGFNDVDERFAVSLQYFTPVGWKSFERALRKSALLTTIYKQQQIMTAIPAGEPMVKSQGLREGDYVWDIEVPIILTIRAGGKSKSATPTLVVTVKKVPTSQNPSGLGIEQWMLY